LGTTEWAPLFLPSSSPTPLRFYTHKPGWGGNKRIRGGVSR